MYYIANKKGKLKTTESDKGKIVFQTHDEKLRDQVFNEDFTVFIKNVVNQCGITDDCIKGVLYKFLKIHIMKSNETFKFVYYGTSVPKQKALIDNLIVLFTWMAIKDMKVIYGKKGKTFVKCLKVRGYYFVDSVIKMGNYKAFVMANEPHDKTLAILKIDDYISMLPKLNQLSIKEQCKRFMNSN